MIIHASPSGDKKDNQHGETLPKWLRVAAWEQGGEESPQRSEAASADTCSYCGKVAKKKGVVLQRCSICKHASYCGAKCQQAGWKRHKKTCVSDVDLEKKLMILVGMEDWRGVMACEGRVEGMLERKPHVRPGWLGMFALAHTEASLGAGSTAACSLMEQQIDLLGTIQHFRDQGDAMCRAAENLELLGRREQAAKQYERARAVAEAHGFFQVECTACEGLGDLAIKDGRFSEGLDLLRNALAAV